MTLEENTILQSTMDVVHKQFISDIEKRRKKKIKGKIIDLAQGQIFSGEEAKSLGRHLLPVDLDTTVVNLVYLYDCRDPSYRKTID